MDKIVGVVRHVIGIAGGILIGLGLVAEADWTSLLTNFDAVTGGIMAVVAIAASIYAKFKDGGGLGGLFGKKD